MIGGIMAINNQMTIGQFTSFLLYLSVVSVWLLNLGTVYQRWQQAKAALNRISPLSQPPEILDAPESSHMQTPRGAIEFRGVSLKLDGTYVLRDVDLIIPAGETVAIVGPTGSGKTQLVNLLARVSDPTDGEIFLDGMNIRDILLEDLRDAIAYVPQSTFLFSRELRDNILMGFDGATERDLEQAIHISRLSNDLPQIPHGLQTLVGERGVMLSGGQKQRVAIARAIIRDPAVLVLDDALSSVDTHTAAEILGSLRHVVRSRTSVIIAHRVASVKDADRILVMDNGRLVEQGTHDELVAAGGFYTKLVDREMALGH
jgi:ATP-binding cassette subfamily B protein